MAKKEETAVQTVPENLFEGVEKIPVSAGVQTSIAREESVIKAMVFLAKQYPRNQNVAYSQIMASCIRPTFAEKASYAFPRSTSIITGPSVNLARECARIWGNINYGLKIIELTEDDVHIQGFAYDLETNNYVVADDKFKKLIYRKATGWGKPDERDLRELINRRGAIAVRSALLQIIPPDIVEDALEQCKKTVIAVAKGELKQGKDQAIKALIKAFTSLGVTVQMLEAYVGHDLKLLNAEEIQELRGVRQSIADGNTRREEHFTFEQKGAATGTIDMADLKTKPPETAKKELELDSDIGGDIP